MAILGFMRTKTQKLLGIGGILLIATLLVVLAFSRGWLSEMESRAWDWRLRFIAGQKSHNPKIKLIMIDQMSLDHFADQEKIFWPWPRSLYVPVLEFLKEGKAGIVAFDMLFSESGSQIADDELFAQAVSKTVPVVSALVLRHAREGVAVEPNSCESLRPYLAPEIAPELARFKLQRFHKALTPISEVSAASTALGNVSSAADGDAIFRRTWPGAYCGEYAVLNLPFAVARQIQGDTFSLGDFGALQDDAGGLLVRFFGGAGTYESYSFHAIVASYLQLQAGEKPHIDPLTFQDSYVFVGTNAPGLLDLRAVPVHGAYSGVELNATVLDNILGRLFLQRLSLEASIVLTLVLLGCSLVTAVYVNRHQLFAALGLLGGWLLVSVAAASMGWWIPVVIPLLGMGFVLLLGFLLQYQLEGKQHRFLRGAFQHYVAPEVIDTIVSNPALLSLGGERRELTIFFSDIKGFTTLSEGMAPSDLVRLLNTLLSEMTDIILQEQGTIDKYQGDAIIAFWNAPLVVSDHRERAVRAALRCQQRLKELELYFTQEFGVDLQMRIGINTGVVTVGNFGSSKRFNYTMIGDAANLASRLEGVNKVFGTTILVSEGTQAAVADAFTWRRVGDVQVKGRSHSVRIYEPLSEHSLLATHEDRKLFERARENFESGSSREALDLFKRLEHDPVSQAYVQRIEEDRQTAESSPIWVLSEK